MCKWCAFRLVRQRRRLFTAPFRALPVKELILMINPNQTIAASEQWTPSVRRVLASLSLSMLLSSLGTSIANVGLPALAQAFSASFQAVQWIVLAYLLAITTLIVSVGRLGDLIGRRRLLLVGIVVFTLASALCGLVPVDDNMNMAPDKKRSADKIDDMAALLMAIGVFGAHADTVNLDD